ncbi:polysaccharide pyruvyl transferase family protein [Sphingobacterium gobiense]|uniref:Polysaccharide pyruvyl transferase domain-containing protein n=1 Tax=Sphingobacterium gobiense TaxID=1382456 RepID=A0A2S9JG26_9SPHI|nr:polysaccharide pyruvyl transferase family protein [Sphingobacterium gobiense]PRD51912.1 hypothetical protein C5749_16565 [Sphingobacterium gobiense]
MMNNKLIILAPNDRYNYGDLLFSYIIKFHLAKYYDDVVDVSTIENDLTDVGGDKVKEISYLYSLEDNSHNDIIVAGGESFCSKWQVCVSYLSPNYGKFLKVVRKGISGILKLNKVYNSVADYVAKVVIGGKTFFPYTIGKHEINNVRNVFYNSLGGSFIKESHFPKRVEDILKSIDYLSIRDRGTHELVKGAGISNYLYPDCAIQMSDLFDKDYLENLISDKNKDFISSQDNGYIVFQIKKSLGFANYREIVHLLRQIKKTYNKKIYLCPVGFALGHEDHIVLEKIYRDLGDEDIVFYQSGNTIWDIMYVISSSSLYIGTSLHGAITAMSFDVPYLGIMVNKTIRYIKEWGIKDMRTTSENLQVLEIIGDLLMTQKDVLSINSQWQKSFVTESFGKMIKLIKQSSN